MGSLKHWELEQRGRGFWSVGSKYVCAQCVEDPALKAFIDGHAENAKCTCCGATTPSPSAVHFDTFVGLLLERLATEWGDPNSECVGWEGGWVGGVMDTYDLLFDEVALELHSGELQSDLLASLVDREWCKRDFYALDPSEVLRYGWKRFTEVTKHRVRYVFLRLVCTAAEDDGEYVPPERFLDALNSVLHSLGLHRNMPSGTSLYRIRPHGSGEQYALAADLGPPPEDRCTQASRMSPAGIPMFYGALQRDTCMAEVFGEDQTCAAGTAAIFNTVRDMVFLDLTRVPPVPSIFEANRQPRHNILFLRGFLRDFACPIEKDGREHIEYVPTQIVAEYIRHIYRTPDGQQVDGILYPSARHGGGAACVIFTDSNGVANPGQETDSTLLVLQRTEPFGARPTTLLSCLWKRARQALLAFGWRRAEPG